jgi:hypothetical protein
MRGESTTTSDSCQSTEIIPSLLANLMLPDGAERQLEDWTIFLLNQTSFNTIAPVLALEQPAAEGEGKPDMLYVLNLVRTKHDKTVKRCDAHCPILCYRLNWAQPRLQRRGCQGPGDLY